MEGSIKDYITMAEDMINDPNFKESPIKKLEELIKNPSSCLSGDHADNFIKKPENKPDRIEFERTFIALVAPSFCGKTQSAFAILYFALNQDAINPSRKSQPVYANFCSLNRMIKEVATADMQVIQVIKNEKSEGTLMIIEID
jgi:hypothetical protein